MTGPMPGANSGQNPSQPPVLAVLPFQVAGKGAADDPLAQGLLEDICGELTRFRSLQVISWMSGMAVAGLSDREAGARLGASHLLRGSLRRADERLRVTAALVDCSGGRQLWSEQYDFSAGDVFAVQDEVVARIAATLSTRLEETARDDLRRKPTDSLAAYELTLRGLALLRQGSASADEEARGLFERAIALDPHYARAHAGISLSWFNEWSCHFWSQFEENGQRAYTHAHRALEIDDRDALLHVVIGKVLNYRREFDRAAWYFDRALALCPNDADMLMEMSIGEAFLGRPELGAEHAERALRLNPCHPNHYYAYAAIAHAAAGNHERAAALAAAIDGFPIVDVPAFVAIAYANLGRMEEGRAMLAVYEREYRDWINGGREAAPGEACRWLLTVNPYRRAQDRAVLAEGFRLLDDACGKPSEAAASGTAPGSGAAPAEAAALVPEAGQWRLSFAGQTVRLPDLKGLHDIRRLLERPGTEVHCLDLAERGDEHFAGDAALDEPARRTLKARIRDLQEDLAEAEDRNDPLRAERLRGEIEELVDTLAKALGLGGRSRRLGSLAERARTTVTWRIRHALRKIEAAHPALGRHLANSLRTGTFCAYRPERSIAWQLSESPEGKEQRFSAAHQGAVN